MPTPVRTFPRTFALLALGAACVDAPTRPHAAPDAPPVPALAIVDATRGGPEAFHWLTPTVPTQPTTFPAPFDAAALAELAVEVCALDAAETACAGAPVARYTASTTPYAQQIRVDAAREFFLVYWNTAASTGGEVAAGRRYRARVLRGTGAAARPLGSIDVQVTATSGEANAVDRSRYAAVVRGQQLALRFRVSPPAADEPPIPADDVRAAAAALYDAIARNDSLAVVVETRNLLGAAVPLLEGAAAERTAPALMQQGLPVAVGAQADLVARALRQGTRATVASFATAAADAGVTVSASGAPVTPDALAALLAPLAGRAAYTAEELVPAIVLALGQARVAQGGAAPTDPVWGDGHLDALQTTLLYYAVHLAGEPSDAPGVASSAPVAAARAGGATGAAMQNPAPRRPLPRVPYQLRDAARRFGRGLVGVALGIPTNPLSGIAVSVCGSVLMNSYRFQVQGTPLALGRRGLELPTESDLVATLVFDFVPNEAGEWVLGAACPPLPPNGPAAGKRVLWRRTGDIVPHTNDNLQETSTTGADGQSYATLTTRQEVVPVPLRTLAKEATGTVTVRALGLIPGFHGLEFGVGGGVMNPTETGVRYSVKYYDWPAALDADFTVGLRGPVLSASTFWAVGQRAESMRLTRTDHGDAVEYYGTGPVSYTHYRIEGNTSPTGCPVVPRHTVSGRLGFGVVALAASESGDGRLMGMPEFVEPYSLEHFAFVCPPPRGEIPSSVGGFGLLVAAVYGPLDPGPFRFLSANPVTEWTVVGEGVLRGVQNRTVQTVIGPVTEQSTFTLRLVP